MRPRLARRTCSARFAAVASCRRQGRRTAPNSCAKIAGDHKHSTGDNPMATKARTDAKTGFVDKRWLKEKLAELDARQGFTVDPTVTVQQVRDMMLADGIRPEKNEFSREIIRMRYEGDL